MLKRFGPPAAFVLAASTLLFASTPTFWTVSTQADFLKGDVTNLSIDADGRVFLGPATSQLTETSAPFLWTLVAGPDGSLYAGTGNEGKVLKIGRDGKTTDFFVAPEMEIHALAPAPNGGLYVASSPDGKIYRVSADGTSTPFFDPEDKYIWALAVAPDGTVFAATGQKGNIYRITPDGKGTVFYKTNTTNVVSLAIDKNGNVLAGTESPGRIFRIDKAGKPFVLLDSPYKEIHALKIASDGAIYATAFSGTPGGEDRASPILPTTPEAAAPARAPVPSVSAEITAIAVVDQGTGLSAGATREARQHNAKGAVYRIRPDGLWDTLWEAMDDWPFDLLVESDGALLVGTGKEGKIYRLSGNPARATLLARVEARQVTSLMREASGRIIAATSNPGKVFALAGTRAASGSYESDVRDAGTVATWGEIRWRATGRPGEVEISTRSGNTATPDETWSTWSKAYTTSDGERISSPNARYLQWRALFKGSTGSAGSSGSGPGSEGPVLTSVTAAYLPRNLRPVVLSITVHPPGTVFQKPFSTGELEIAGFDDNTSDGRNAPQSKESAASVGPLASPAPALGRKVYQKGLQTFVWKADDDNDDRLVYEIYYRREGETAWKPLKKGVWDPIFVWDTTSVPDGTYYVKVAASDAPSNSPATALTGELESVSFDVDNTPPVIELQSATRTGPKATVKFVVRDVQSAVQRVEYSLDASRWRVVYPVDGIADSRRQAFEISLDDATAGSIIIRATDAMNNVATAVAEIKK
jgi:sugar lactone lactonase YvrE